MCKVFNLGTVFNVIYAIMIPTKQAKGSFSKPHISVIPEDIAGPSEKPKVPIAINILISLLFSDCFE